MKIYIFLDENGTCWGWSQNRNMDSEIEIDVDASHPIFTTDPRLFTYSNGQFNLDDAKVLADAKRRKKLELNSACNAAILSNFSVDINGTTYWFSHDKDAQDNFEMADKNLNNGRIASIPWTSYDANGNVVRLTFDKTSFEPVYVAHAQVMPTNVSKFRDTLEPKVDAATTVDEVNAITWDSV